MKGWSPGVLLFVLTVGLVAGCSTGGTQAPSAQPSPSVAPSAVPSATPQAAKRIVGYYTSWSIYQRDFQVADIPADKLTHVNYAFANVDGETGECILGDKWSDDANFRYLGELKKKHPHLKALISVGGWTWSGQFSNMALTEESRQHFVASCIERFLGKRYEGIFDGIDIDWEFPVSGGLAKNAARPEDKHNYTLLMQEFRRQLDALSAQTGRQYLLTIAAPAGPSTYANIELKEISQTLDWLNLMAYDFHGSWDEKTNLHAALYGAAQDPGPAELNGHAAVQAYLQAGLPPEKVVLGVPFYGRGWAGVPDVDHGLYQPTKGLPKGTWEQGAFDYKDLAKNYVDKNGYTRYWHDEVKGPWLYNPANGVFITYEDAESLGVKADYVVEQGLGGVMFWELSADDGTLLGVLHSRMGPR